MIRGIVGATAAALAIAACTPGATVRPPHVSRVTTTPAPTPGPAAAPAPAPAVARTQLTFVDAGRPTPAHGGVAATPTRTLPTTVWYPTTGPGPYPLVVFAHGYAARPETYAALLTHWAASGYVVAAPEIPVLGAETPGGASAADLGDAPGDLSFVLTGMLGPTDPLRASIDARRVAFAGHSDGEIVAFVSAFDARFRDRRVRAVVALAGKLGTSGPPPLTGTGVATLHLLADDDEFNPIDDALGYDRAQLPAPKWVITLRGAHHLPPFADATDPHFGLVAAVTTAFLDSALTDRAGAGERLAQIVADAPGLASLDSSPDRGQ